MHLNSPSSGIHTSMRMGQMSFVLLGCWFCGVVIVAWSLSTTTSSSSFIVVVGAFSTSSRRIRETASTHGFLPSQQKDDFRRHRFSTSSAPTTTLLSLAAPAAISAKETANSELIDPSSSSSSTTGGRGVGPLELTTSSEFNDQNDINDDVDDDIEDVEFPPPLSTFDTFKRAATFWSTAIPIIANYYGLIGNVKLQELLGSTELDEEYVESLWNELHEDGAAKLAECVTELKGFYVKTAQIISTRADLFPKQYTDALSGFTDNLDPMPGSMAKAIVKNELLNRDEKFSDVFVEFDDVPLGAASVAQVHRAVLTEEYGGREVAVKIQRPSIESKLLGDVANLKAIAKTFRNADALPLDYYTVMVELEKQLADEFDFVAEAVAMDRIYKSLTQTFDGMEATEPPLVLPRPVPGLVSKRVLVMDYLKGVPLSRAREEMEKRGIDPNSPESKLFGRNLLKSLTYCFGRNILETGFFHADPHPGNIFVLEDGRIGLIDFGQVKQISGRNKETLAKVMIALAERVGDDRPEDLERIGKLALELGVELNEDAKDEAPAAVAMWLFDGATKQLPGGYDLGELSPNSPVKELKSFPQDLVLVGRSSILIKGLSDRLGIPWSLANEWAPIARQVLDAKSGKVDPKIQRVRFRAVMRTFRQWAKGRSERVVRRLPSPIRSRIASLLVKMDERKTRRKLTNSKK